MRNPQPSITTMHVTMRLVALTIRNGTLRLRETAMLPPTPATRLARIEAIADQSTSLSGTDRVDVATDLVADLLHWCSCTLKRNNLSRHGSRAARRKGRAAAGDPAVLVHLAREERRTQGRSLRCQPPAGAVGERSADLVLFRFRDGHDERHHSPTSWRVVTANYSVCRWSGEAEAQSSLLVGMGALAQKKPVAGLDSAPHRQNRRCNPTGSSP